MKGIVFMLWKRKALCPNCRTGKKTYDLDSHSECCPFIHSYHKNGCKFYVPLEQEKKGIIKTIKKMFRH